MIFWIPLVPLGKFDITHRLASANMNGAADSSVTITSEPVDTSFFLNNPSTYLPHLTLGSVVSSLSVVSVTFTRILISLVQKVPDLND